MRISDWSSDVCSSDLMGDRSRTAPGGGELRRERRARSLPGERQSRPAADVRRCLGVDDEPLCAVSGLSPAAGRGRRIQRKVHGEPDGAARRLLCDVRRPCAGDLPELLLPTSALGVLRPAPRHGGIMNAAAVRAAAVRAVDFAPGREPFLRDVFEGLSRQQKTLPAKYFYDTRGSELFEEITVLDEYYPTRTEIGILEANAAEIARLAGPGVVLIEPGAGATRKVRKIGRAHV